LVEGFAGRISQLENGHRQITAIHVPGDFVDLHSFLLKEMDHAVMAISRCRVVMFPHAQLATITEQYPHLTRLLWLATLIDAAIHRQWLAVMGGLPAISHMAHLVCELYLRLNVIGCTEDKRFTLPVTQSELADAMGLTPVHVNRVLQELRRESLLTWEGASIEILDWPNLQALADFDPRYLHQRTEPR
jgi:CRP-like cAMP-binding protein